MSCTLVVDTSTFKPLVMACISDNRDASPLLNRDDIASNEFNCLIIKTRNDAELFNSTHDCTSKGSEDVGSRKCWEQSLMNGRVIDDLFFQPFRVLVALPADGAISQRNNGS